ncbi:unnamed protein product [Meganyctiphanes norvegica]|uniref:carbonic anhydrase n=1 Tax=Meganyctiphanes norvegica TaxID=48144 RepID=A0AAV2SU96_MEGNR
MLGRVVVLLVSYFIAVSGDIHNDNREEHWGYHDHNGPSDWASLYPTCGGSHQSPINIITSDLVHTWIDPYHFHNYEQNVQQIKLTNTGHSVNVEVIFANEAPYINGGGLGDDYILKQFHFHWGSISSQGSEHNVDSTRYPMEIHNVFYKSSYGSYDEATAHSDGIAVLAVFVSIATDDNSQLQNIINFIPEVNQAESTFVGDVDLNLKALLPMTTHSFYWYRGSFTTPGCNEVVTWTVFKEPITISESQLDVFRNLLDSDNMQMQDNFRPTQPLNDRVVYTSSVGDSGNYAGPGSTSNKPGVGDDSSSNKPGVDGGVEQATTNKPYEL